MRRALLVAGAPSAESRTLASMLPDHDLVIAADSGADACLALGRVPDVVVGDMDSISAQALESVRSSGGDLVTLPADKDFTDLDAALTEASRLTVTALTVTGVLGGRLDHELGVIGSLMRSQIPVIDVCDSQANAWVVSSSRRPTLSLRGRGRTVSVLAVLEPANVSLTGMRFPLTRCTLEILSSLGISNVIADETADVFIHHGSALVLSPKMESAGPALLSDM